jgi:hypothetical protein
MTIHLPSLIEAFKGKNQNKLLIGENVWEEEM